MCFPPSAVFSRMQRRFAPFMLPRFPCINTTLPVTHRCRTVFPSIPVISSVIPSFYPVARRPICHAAVDANWCNRSDFLVVTRSIPFLLRKCYSIISADITAPFAHLPRRMLPYTPFMQTSCRKDTTIRPHVAVNLHIQRCLSSKYPDFKN